MTKLGPTNFPGSEPGLHFVLPTEARRQDWWSRDSHRRREEEGEEEEVGVVEEEEEEEDILAMSMRTHPESQDARDAMRREMKGRRGEEEEEVRGNSSTSRE